MLLCDPEIGGCYVDWASLRGCTLRLSTSPRYLMLPRVTTAAYSAPGFRRGRHRQTFPHGAVMRGNAAAMAVPRDGSVCRRLLSARIYGKSRITHRRRLWLATMMLGAESMGRAARRNICSVEKTITTPACRFPFARPNSGWCGGHISLLAHHFNRRQNVCDAILSTII